MGWLAAAVAALQPSKPTCRPSAAACAALPWPQAFLQRCIKSNRDDTDVAMHWTFLAEAHAAGDAGGIRDWVAEELKRLG